MMLIKKFILNTVTKGAILCALCIGVYLVFDAEVSSEQLQTYADVSIETKTKADFAEAWRTSYLDIKVGKSETSTSDNNVSINKNKVESSRNSFNLPWYQGYTMEHKYKDLDVEAEMGTAEYNKGGSKVITHMDICVSSSNVNLYAAVFADKTKNGDVSSQVPGYNKEFHQSIKVTNKSGSNGKIAIADNRILVAIPPKVRAKFTGENFEPGVSNKKYDSVTYARGIYVDVVLEDGTVIACITGDAKSSSDRWYVNNMMHGYVKGGCLEFLTNDGVSNGPIASYSEFFGSQKIKSFRVYTDIQAVKANTNAITYYFSENK